MYNYEKAYKKYYKDNKDNKDEEVVKVIIPYNYPTTLSLFPRQL